jgi:hypothetical protein
MATDGTTTRATHTPVSAWEDDPQSSPAAAPVRRPCPELAEMRLAVAIRGEQPPPRVYEPGTASFRYWTAADALARGSAYWAGLVPKTAGWHAGRVLPVSLDEGNDLNAYYDRERLCFFHARVRGVSVFSGESPDVLTHELGHAFLDVVRPELWDTASIEAAAFHESFGDISAVLAALQLDSVREGVLSDTDGRLYRSSRISRLAEQLGWAVRQSHPDAVEADCLRNAVNSFFYRPPEMLPPFAPASDLSSEPHSFSRVFTAGWLESLAGMLAGSGQVPTPVTLEAVSIDAGRLLLGGIARAPITSNYFAQVAAQMIVTDAKLFNGRYAGALRDAFVRRGILSLSSMRAIAAQAAAASKAAARSAGGRGRIRAAGDDEPPDRTPRLSRVSWDGAEFGLSASRLVARAPERSARGHAVSSAVDAGPLTAVSPVRASRAFLEDLFRRGRVDLGTQGSAAAGPPVRRSRMTHELEARGRAVVISRRRFDCGFAI